MNENVSNFSLNIRGNIEAGKLAIEIIDPDGVKQDNFSLECQINTDKQSNNRSTGKKETVRGEIRHSIENPTHGIWKVLIEPIKAKGDLVINYTRRNEQGDQAEQQEKSKAFFSSAQKQFEVQSAEQKKEIAEQKKIAEEQRKMVNELKEKLKKCEESRIKK
jgi:serine phosphatase RsbU (regulator of sigma subunit)